MQEFRIPKRHSGKIVTILSLDGHRILTLDENNILTQYRLPVGTVLSQVILPFKPRRLITMGHASIIALVPDERSVFEVDL